MQSNRIDFLVSHFEQTFSLPAVTGWKTCAEWFYFRMSLSFKMSAAKVMRTLEEYTAVPSWLLSDAGGGPLQKPGNKSLIINSSESDSCFKRTLATSLFPVTTVSSVCILQSAGPPYFTTNTQFHFVLTVRSSILCPCLWLSSWLSGGGETLRPCGSTQLYRLLVM